MKLASPKRPCITWLHWFEISRIVKSIETESRQSTGCQGLGGGGVESDCSMGLGVSFWVDKNVSKLDRNDGYITMCIY